MTDDALRRLFSELCMNVWIDCTVW